MRLAFALGKRLDEEECEPDEDGVNAKDSQKDGGRKRRGQEAPGYSADDCGNHDE